MYYLLTAEEVRAIDSYNTGLGQGTELLMQNFASTIAAEVNRRAAELTFKRVLVVAGCGNNGGDGICAARNLIRLGFRADILTPMKIKEKAAATALRLAVMDNIRVFTASADVDFEGYDVIIDALFGIGLDRDITGETASLVRRINSSRAMKVAVDVPSGLGENGAVRGIAVKADVTVTACGYKTSLLFGEGQNYCGEVAVADINCIYPRLDYPLYVDKVSLPARKRVGNKGDYANVYIVAGSYVGAGMLAYEACRAALCVGAGKSHLVVAECDRSIYEARIKEEIVTAVPSADGQMIFDPDAFNRVIPNGAVVLLGSGGGKNAELTKLAAYLLTRTITLILDADGINMFRDYAKLSTATAKVIFTPHVKEFARMSGLSIAEITASPLQIVTEWAAKHRVTVLLKSNYCIATDGEQIRVTAVGSPAQAKGGSGDVLAGVLAGMCGYLPLFDAAIDAAVVCGLAASKLAKSKSDYGVMASDIIDVLAKGL